MPIMSITKYIIYCCHQSWVTVNV